MFIYDEEDHDVAPQLSRNRGSWRESYRKQGSWRGKSANETRLMWEMMTYQLNSNQTMAHWGDWKLH